MSEQELREKLRKLGEEHYGNSLYGEHLAYQHKLQGLIAQYATQCRIDELRECNEKMECFRSKHLDENTINRRNKQITNENINLFKSINNRRIIELQSRGLK